MSDDKVTTLNAKTVQPRDVVVLETFNTVSAEQAEALRQRLCELMPWIKPDNVLVLSGMHLSVVRPPSE